MHLFSTNIQSIFGPCYNWNYTSYSSLHYLLIQFMPGKEPKFRFSVHFEYFGICLKNNGTCIEHKAFEEFSCECPQHYGGRRCEIELCKEMNCKNGGFCSVYIINGKREEICDCRKQNGIDLFVGDTCEIPAVCGGNPCQNGGSCDMATIDDPLKACLARWRLFDNIVAFSFNLFK